MTATLESLVHLQADRDELLQLLSLLNTHWHQNEEAFCNRLLAEWPQWCAVQGFRFALLTELAHNLESTLSYPEGCPGLDQLITALGPAATTAQLLDSLDQDLPQFLEGFDQLLQISQDETAALGAQAGGSGKGAEWMKHHPGADAAVAAVGIGGGIAGVAIYRARKAIQKEQQEMADYQQRVLDKATQKAKAEASAWRQKARDEIDLYPQYESDVSLDSKEKAEQEYNYEQYRMKKYFENGEAREAELNAKFQSEMLEVEKKYERAEAGRLSDELPNSIEEKASEEVEQDLRSEEQSLLESVDIAVDDKARELVADEIAELESDVVNSISSIASGTVNDIS